MSTHGHRGWYSRGYIPHWDEPTATQMVTIRLHDSMPAERRHEWEALLRLRDESQRQTRLQEYLDAGYGSCWLREPRIAALIEATLWYHDGVRYRLLAWVVMPNHVHVIFHQMEGHTLPEVVHSWKSYSAREANKLLGREGAFWYRDFHDRFMRNERHLERAIAYVHANPVRAGFVSVPGEWPFSSARFIPM